MTAVRRVCLALAVVALVLSASGASAEIAAWDQAKATALGKQLSDACQALYDTFYKQPPATAGSGHARAYQRLKQGVRRIRTEARELSSALEKGEGQPETLPIYENLMQAVRSAREDAREVFTTSDVADKAAAARQVLNQLSPYYDPDAQPLGPVTR
jgi:hypothetical protein